MKGLTNEDAGSSTDDGRTVTRPWGSFTILDESASGKAGGGADYKVKRIEVLPAKRLSYQKHASRAEHWTIVLGRARVTLDGARVDLGVGESIDIAAGSAHRVENPGTQSLVLIEVQLGSYLGEDDIVRLEDDFGRA